MTLFLLALIYACSAFFFKIPQETNATIPYKIFKDAKFWLANAIIYLPVIYASGLFFHLEGICKIYAIPLKTWEHVSQIQIPGIIIGQIFLGYLWRNYSKTPMVFLALMLLSQIVWLGNLFRFNPTICIVCGIAGWSLFGVLINAFWSYLYRNQPQRIDESIRTSVAFGFLANAIGPILFCAFL